MEYVRAYIRFLVDTGEIKEDEYQWNVDFWLEKWNPKGTMLMADAESGKVVSATLAEHFKKKREDVTEEHFRNKKRN